MAKLLDPRKPSTQFKQYNDSGWTKNDPKLNFHPFNC